MSSTPEEDMENADAIRANLGMDDVISTKAREIADALCLPHEDHKYPCPMADWIRTELEKAYAQGFSDCRERAAKCALTSGYEMLFNEICALSPSEGETK